MISTTVPVPFSGLTPGEVLVANSSTTAVGFNTLTYINNNLNIGATGTIIQPTGSNSVDTFLVNFTDGTAAFQVDTFDNQFNVNLNKTTLQPRSDGTVFQIENSTGGQLVSVNSSTNVATIGSTISLPNLTPSTYLGLNGSNQVVSTTVPVPFSGLVPGEVLYASGSTTATGSSNFTFTGGIFSIGGIETLIQPSIDGTVFQINDSTGGQLVSVNSSTNVATIGSTVALPNLTPSTYLGLNGSNQVVSTSVPVPFSGLVPGEVLYASGSTTATGSQNLTYINNVLNIGATGTIIQPTGANSVNTFLVNFTDGTAAFQVDTLDNQLNINLNKTTLQPRSDGTVFQIENSTGGQLLSVNSSTNLATIGSTVALPNLTPSTYLGLNGSNQVVSTTVPVPFSGLIPGEILIANSSTTATGSQNLTYINNVLNIGATGTIIQPTGANSVNTFLVNFTDGTAAFQVDTLDNQLNINLNKTTLQPRSDGTVFQIENSTGGQLVSVNSSTNLATIGSTISLPNLTPSTYLGLNGSNQVVSTTVPVPFSGLIPGEILIANSSTTAVGFNTLTYINNNLNIGATGTTIQPTGANSVNTFLVNFTDGTAAFQVDTLDNQLNINLNKTTLQPRSDGTVFQIENSTGGQLLSVNSSTNLATIGSTVALPNLTPSTYLGLNGSNQVVSTTVPVPFSGLISGEILIANSSTTASGSQNLTYINNNLNIGATGTFIQPTGANSVDTFLVNFTNGTAAFQVDTLDNQLNVNLNKTTLQPRSDGTVFQIENSTGGQLVSVNSSTNLATIGSTVALPNLTPSTYLGLNGSNHVISTTVPVPFSGLTPSEILFANSSTTATGSMNLVYTGGSFIVSSGSTALFTVAPSGMVTTKNQTLDDQYGNMFVGASLIVSGPELVANNAGFSAISDVVSTAYNVLDDSEGNATITGSLVVSNVSTLNSSGLTVSGPVAGTFGIFIGGAGYDGFFWVNGNATFEGSAGSNITTRNIQASSLVYCNSSYVLTGTTFPGNGSVLVSTGTSFLNNANWGGASGGSVMVSTGGGGIKPLNTLVSGQMVVATGSGGLTTVAASYINWNVVSATGTQSMAAYNGYITNYSSGLVTLVLPTTISAGATMRIAGLSSSGWKLTQNASQLIHFGTATTTTGTAGYLASTQACDSIELVCAVANTTFIVVSSIGNITYN